MQSRFAKIASQTGIVEESSLISLFLLFDRPPRLLSFFASPMASSSRTKFNAPVLRTSSGYSSSSSHGGILSFASSSSSFSSRPTGFFQRCSSPTCENLGGSVPSTASIRFSLDRSISPRKSIIVSSREQVIKNHQNPSVSQKRTCLCSPSIHPGSFRCRLHKNVIHSISSPSNRLNARRSAMTNSVVRIGTVEGELVKRALTALIRPSSHQQKRRSAFKPRSSRLSIMSKADD